MDRLIERLQNHPAGLTVAKAWATATRFGSVGKCHVYGIVNPYGLDEKLFTIIRGEIRVRECHGDTSVAPHAEGPDIDYIDFSIRNGELQIRYSANTCHWMVIDQLPSLVRDSVHGRVLFRAEHKTLGENDTVVFGKDMLSLLAYEHMDLTPGSMFDSLHLYEEACAREFEELYKEHHS